jgi:hypothetical protein
MHTTFSTVTNHAAAAAAAAAATEHWTCFNTPDHDNRCVAKTAVVPHASKSDNGYLRASFLHHAANALQQAH